MNRRPSYFRWTIVLLAALLPVAAIGLYSFRSSQKSLWRLTRQNSMSIAAAAGETLHQQLHRSIQLCRVVAAFPTFARSVADHDVDKVRDRLRLMVESSPDVDRAYVLDTDGVLWCDWPQAPESLNQNFSHRDYFLGVSRNWQTYVSEVFQRQAQPKPLVVAVATPVKVDQTVRGVLVIQHRLETITGWLRRITLGEGGAVIVLDHNGTLAGHSTLSVLNTRIEKYADLDAVKQALAGQGSTIEHVDPLSGRKVVASIEPVKLEGGGNWVVISQQDREQAFSPAADLGRQIAVAVAIVATLAVITGILLAQVSERNRRMSLQLAQKNRQLEEAINSEREANQALKTAQGQLVQQEKMAGLGQMVAGIAHEINNPLSFVSNNIAVLQRDLPSLRDLLQSYRDADADLDRCRPELMQAIREQAQGIDLSYSLENLDGLLGRSREGLRRIQQIVMDLRDFARLDGNLVVEADINSGVQSTVNIIHGRAKRKQVELEMVLGQIPPVTCCLSRINQVVMNLVSNAIDACQPGGHVAIRTYQEEGMICVAVQDNGSGIDPSVANRIFDPFFTTKPQGEGVGLGLSISYGIARDHGGTIDVETTRGAGSTFTLRLPRKPPQAVPQA